ncbi:MurR/RpiR family transcriptional regulator [Litchfieldia alkalitelluris]|uniref:MurR/RpiR family transcriptional regulator n=1 Tax=Litchfieldia alkalitelluris TaxID=304268 RepID=UPI000995E424|nr:MurR/RpiR family transcriptional regulator [Litchfieldia alkalitelluris]
MFPSEVIATFNELEYSLYNYVIKNGEKVVYMRIRDLANETHVSTSTILRFCRKLNCEGFSVFKVKLKLYLKKGSNQEMPLKSMQHFLSEFIERTLSGNLESQIKEAARVINNADNVLFVGIGNSGILAQYGARYFSSLGKFSLYINDPYFPIHSHYLNNSITIALSVSGETEHTVQQVSKLKEEGNTIISITNNKQSTLARISDLNISYYVTEEKTQLSNVPINITTQLPVIYILESLAREGWKRWDGSDASFQK